MTSREVMDSENTTWTCVQAYGGLQAEAADKATQLTDNGSGQVTVVCTPSGGAQTVRLELPANWLDTLSDDELVQAISAQQQ